MAIQVKQLIADAFLELCKSKPIDRISVKSIVEKSNIGKQTFYNHFEDKNALVTWIFEEDVRKIKPIYVDHAFSSPRDLEEYYRVLQRKRAFYSNIVHDSGENRLYRLHMDFAKKCYQGYLLQRLGAEELTEELMNSIDYAVYGQMGILFDWIRDGMKKEPEQLNRIVMDNIPERIKKYTNL